MKDIGYFSRKKLEGEGAFPRKRRSMIPSPFEDKRFKTKIVMNTFSNTNNVEKNLNLKGCKSLTIIIINNNNNNNSNNNNNKQIYLSSAMIG